MNSILSLLKQKKSATTTRPTACKEGSSWGQGENTNATMSKPERNKLPGEGTNSDGAGKQEGNKQA